MCFDIKHIIFDWIIETQYKYIIYLCQSQSTGFSLFSTWSHP